MSQQTVLLTPDHVDWADRALSDYLLGGPVWDARAADRLRELSICPLTEDQAAELVRAVDAHRRRPRPTPTDPATRRSGAGSADQ